MNDVRSPSGWAAFLRNQKYNENPCCYLTLVKWVSAYRTRPLRAHSDTKHQLMAGSCLEISKFIECR